MLSLKFFGTLILLTTFCILGTVASKIELSNNGKTAYKIIFDKENSILSEKTAVKELKTFLKKVTNTEFLESRNLDIKGRFISVGWNKVSEKFFGRGLINELGDEEFIIRSSQDGDIYIIGGRPRGTLYGVLHFLDKIIGVSWLSYDYTYIPNKPNLKLKSLDIRETPSFEYRFIAANSRHPDPVSDSIYLYRNRFGQTMYHGSYYFYNMEKRVNPQKFPTLPDKEYGIIGYYAPIPEFAHTIPVFIPAKKYFKSHPEWWELIDGKRQNNNFSSAMCLTNQELVKEIAKVAIKMIEKNPKAKYISISEGDTIKKYCQCSKCQDKLKKYGTKSGLMLEFVNNVAAIIHKKYPDIMVTTLAYMHTEKAPQNIKASKNVAVFLATWYARESEAYNDPRNKSGLEYINELKKWKAVCPNMGIWDYVSTYYYNFIPYPNLHTIIPNLKALKEAGANYYFCEADHNYGGYRAGEASARIFLLSRGLFNVNADTNKLLKEFTDKFYGKEAGFYVRAYWNLLLNANRRKNYMQMSAKGVENDAPYLRLPIILEADKLLKKAINTAKPGKFKEHVEQLYMQIQFVLLNNWKNYEAEAKKIGLKMPTTFDKTFTDFSAKTQKYRAWHINYEPREKVLKVLKDSYYRTFNVTASKTYGSRPDFAFDRDGKTGWNGGGYSGWLQIEYKEPKIIRSIYTIFNIRDKSVTYGISISLDGKKWQILVPKRTSTEAVILQRIFDSHPMIIAKDTFKPVKARYVRTKIFDVKQLSGKRDWIVIREQEIQ